MIKDREHFPVKQSSAPLDDRSVFNVLSGIGSERHFSVLITRDKQPDTTVGPGKWKDVESNDGQRARVIGSHPPDLDQIEAGEMDREVDIEANGIKITIRAGGHLTAYLNQGQEMKIGKGLKLKGQAAHHHKS